MKQVCGFLEKVVVLERGRGGGSYSRVQLLKFTEIHNSRE